MNIHTNIFNISKLYLYKLCIYTHTHILTSIFNLVISSLLVILSSSIVVTKIKLVETLRHSIVSCASLSIWTMGSKRGALEEEGKIKQ